MWMPQELASQVIEQTCLIVDSALQIGIGYFVAGLVPAILAINAYAYYNKCRCAGLDAGDSIFITTRCMFLGNLPYRRITKRGFLSLDLGLSVVASNHLDALINEALIDVPPAERINNRQTYLNARSAGVAVGGSMRFMYNDYTGMRRDLFGNP